MSRRVGAALSLFAAVLVLVVDQRPAAASVTAVSGGAFGYRTNVGLFGQPPSVRGDGQTSPPGTAESASPSVTLPVAGGNVSQTDPDGARAVYGLAAIFESHGEMTVSSQGTTGPTGSVTSSAEVKDIQPQDPFTAPAPGGVRSTCTASETGLTGSTTITNGRLVLQDPNPDALGEPGEVVVVPPVNPTPGTEYSGVIANVDDYFTVVFNEQIFTADSITVNAVHLFMEGPTAVGDMIIAQSRCGLVATTANQPPTAHDDAYSTGVGQGLTVVAAPGVLANDTDPEAGPLLATKVPPTPPSSSGTTCPAFPARCGVWPSASDPANGSLTLNSDGSFTYTPNAGFQGTDSFTYLAVDQRGRTDSGKVTITVTPSTYLSVNDVWVTEGNTGTTVSAGFTITRSGKTSGTSSVTYATSNGTAAAGPDYTAVPATTVTFSAGQTSKQVAVTVKGDALAEVNETFNLVLSSPVGATISDGTGVGTIQDDDGVALLSVNDVWVTEGGGATATFTLTRSGNTAGPATVTYATANGTAAAGSDYTAVAATTTTFAAGETSKTVSVAVTGDTLPEAHETFSLVLSAPVGATISDGTGVGTIQNDDGAAYLSVGDVTVTEGNSGTVSANFTITRSGNTNGSTTVTYATGTGTATVGTDYTAIASTTVTFAPGQTTKPVAVAVVGDTVDEANETFALNLLSAAGATIVDSAAVGTIVDDEGTVTPGPATFYSVNDISVVEGNSGTIAATFTVTRTGVVSGTGSVQYATANGTAKAPGDYAARATTTLSFAAGQTSKSVTVNVVGDTVTEADETLLLNLGGAVGGVIADSSGTAVIVNDEFSGFAISDVRLVEGASGTAVATFSVTRTGNTGGPASVRYATANGTAVAPGDYTARALTTLPFATGEVTKPITVNVVSDAVTEADETFKVNLSNPVGGVISDSSGTATIVNDDFTQIAINDRSIVEGNSGAAPLTFTVTRSGSTAGAASVVYSTANGSAVAGSDYTAVPATTLTFAAGETVKTVSVSVIGDTAVEPSESFKVNLTSPAGAVIADPAGSGVILNND